MHSLGLVLLLFASIGVCGAHSAFQVSRDYGKHFRIIKRDVNESLDTSLQISGLTATALGANRANAKWENATGPVTGYEITVCRMSEQPECRTESVQKTSYDLKYLDSGTTYEVEVRAFSEEGANRTKGRSERTSFTTPYIPAVEQLQAVPTWPTWLEVRWNTSRDGPSHVEIDVCPVDGGGCVHAGVRNSTHILKGLAPDTEYNVIVRSVAQEGKELAFGPRSNVTARTTPLPPFPIDVELQATCDGFMVASWIYLFPEITGFEVAFCAEGRRCIKTVIDKDSSSHTFRVEPEPRVYKLSMTAYLWRGGVKHTTPAANATATSLPEVPSLEDLEVRAVSLTDVKVNWKTTGDFDIRFRVCRQETPNITCASYVAHGSQLSYTISGLTPNSKYRIEATAVVPAGSDRCQSAEIIRELVTPAEAICRYGEQMRQTLKEVSDNVKALLRRQNRMDDLSDQRDKIYAQCKAMEAKLRNLPEKDLADCLRDINNIINTYQSKAAQPAHSAAHPLPPL